MDRSLEKWKEKLRDHGHRITRPLLEIMKVILSSPRPLAPMEIFNSVRINNPKIGLVTVYRTIEKLENLGLLDHIHHFQNCQAVFPTNEVHKHLIICEKCGRCVYLNSLELESTFKLISEKEGYLLTNHWLELSGLCKDCQ